MLFRSMGALPQGIRASAAPVSPMASHMAMDGHDGRMGHVHGDHAAHDHAAHEHGSPVAPDHGRKGSGCVDACCGALCHVVLGSVTMLASRAEAPMSRLWPASDCAAPGDFLLRIDRPPRA